MRLLRAEPPDHDVCIPGRKTPEPDEAAVRVALSGNACRCSGYQHIVDSVLLAARRMAGMR
jgi:aerobic-type carbon monoxide dehydrogenase small subunit (CoxS/CutS family)